MIGIQNYKDIFQATKIKDTETNEYYHKVVYKNSIEHNGKLYYKEDIETKEA